MMNTKKVLLNVAFAAALTGLIFAGCKKENDTSATDEMSEQLTNGTDESRFSAASDEALDDVNNIALDNSKFRGVNGQWILLGLHTPCNVVIDSSLKDHGTLTVTFNGNDCANLHSRTGSVTLQLPYNAATNTVTPWSTAGCTLTVTFHDFSITRLSDGKSLTFNGSKTITNVNGGLVDDEPDFTAPVVHHITGMMQVTFDNNTSRTWNIDRTRTIARFNNVTTVTITGNATENGYSNVSVWGINRKGNVFTVTINTPVVLSSTCNFNAMSGVRMIHGVIRELTITYGVDQAGNPITNGCPYGFKLNWIGKNGTAKQAVISY
ncbi:MAG: hypothetical protein ABI723_24580 [Bacteroidia bacterium]